MAALATAGELGDHLQRTDLDPVQAQLALELGSGAVRAYCGWEISKITETLQTVGIGTAVLSLPTLCLLDVTEVRVNGEVVTIAWWSRNGQLMLPLGWPMHAVVEVDCEHGFDPVPDVIKLVVLEQAARQLTNPQGLLSASAGSVSRTWASAGKPRLSELDERLLQRYAL